MIGENPIWVLSNIHSAKLNKKNIDYSVSFG